MLNSSIRPVETIDVSQQVEPEPMPLNENLTERRPESRPARQPKRILHFSDGTLEEYSSEEEDEIEPKIEKRSQNQLTSTNIANLAWMPWFYYQSMFVGNKALAACDFLGEYLANFFGIISPKYEYEIEHYKRMLAEEKERKSQDMELGGGGWAPKSTEIISSEQFRSAESRGISS